MPDTTPTPSQVAASRPETDPFGHLLDPVTAEAATKLAGIFTWLADNEFPDYAPMYEHFARRAAAEPWIPAFITRHTSSPFAGVLFFDCIRELTLTQPDLELSDHYERVIAGENPLEPDPWPLVRTLVMDQADALGELLETKTIQTNEVGRSAALLPAFALVSRRFDAPLAVIEVGCSAGLNLFFDRFHVDYGPAGSAGPVDATVRLACDVRGPLRPPIPSAPPEVVSRLGIDLHPVDVTDPDQARWLEACLWPDVPHRIERFRAALALARAEPPKLWTGNAVDLVAQAIEAVPPGVVACLDATWVLAYFSEEDRAALHATLDRLGEQRPLAFVTAEYEGNTPWVPEPARRVHSRDHSSPTLLGLGLWDHGTTEHAALAWVQPHLRWIDWLDETSAG